MSHAVPLAALLAALIATQPASAQTGEGDSPPTESTPLPADTTLAYVGTQTQGPGKGIFVFRLQTRGMEVSQNITLVPLGLAAETPNPSFLELDARRRLLFAVNEIDKFQGKPGGAVSAFAIDSTTGKLKLINQQPSMGQRPCHLTLNKPGNQLLVTNCGSGSVAVLPVAADGRLGPATDFVQHTGKSVNPQRQAGPHALGVTLDPGQQNAFACDLGLDKVLAYRFDAGKGKLAAAKTPAATLKPGAGPRRLVFRPDGKYAYVLNELTSTVVAFGHDPKAVNTTGTLRELQTVSTLPDYYDGPNTTGELGMHPSGKFLYVSNRGHNSVVLFAIDADKGTLSYVEEQNTGGKSPGHFGIEPSAKHLAIANQESNTVLVCRIDGGNGRLKPSGVFASVPSPTCVKFLPPKESGK